MPGQIHVGDITSDGFPDLILTIRKKSLFQDEETEVHILQSMACTPSTCNEKSMKNKRRQFAVKSYAAELE